MNVGSRVVGIGSAYGIIIENQYGVIVARDEDDVGILLVDFDEKFDSRLHNGNGAIDGIVAKNGWFCKEDNLRRVL